MYTDQNLIWFVGAVESRLDPLRLGRVRVRCFGWHTQDKELLPSYALPWANTLQPVNSPGSSPSGLNINTWVFGFFMDGERAQKPIIIGHLPGYTFGSPGTSELPAAARNEGAYTPPGNSLRNDNATTEVVIDPKTGEKWSEPAIPSDASYPATGTQSHESGTYTQTAGSGRYTIQTASGSYLEFQASGDGTIKVFGDGYNIVAGDNFVNIGGTVNLTVGGNVNWNIGGNWTMNVGGNVNWTIGGNLGEEIGGSQKTQAGGSIDIDASRIDLN